MRLFKREGLKSEVSLFGSGRFTAGVIVPLLLKNGGGVKFIRRTSGTSAEALNKAYGLGAELGEREQRLNEESTAMVLTSPCYHAKDICLAAELGYKYIYSEKPIGTCVKDISMLKSLVSSTSSRIVCGFNRRFSPVVQKLKEIPGLETSSCHTLYVVELSDFSESMASFQKGGGTTVAACCHYIDLLIYLHGDIASFSVKKIQHGSLPTVDGYSFVAFNKHKGGATSTLQFLRAEQGSLKSRSTEELRVSSKDCTYKTTDFKSLASDYGGMFKCNSDARGWDEMYRMLVCNPSDKRFATLEDSIENLRHCLEIDGILRDE